MNCTQTLHSSLNIAEQSPVVVPFHVDSAPPLHRLGESRRQEGVSLGSVARHLGITIEDVKRQECTSTDLPLSVLRKWAKVLGLPVTELIREPDDSRSTPLVNRASLVRVMKTAMALLERAGNSRTKWLAQTMVDQLIEIMPELRGISAWHCEGKRRRLDELGMAAERCFSDELFRNVAD